MWCHLSKSVALACVALVLASPAVARADDKVDKDKPAASGTWTKKDGQLKIEFADKEVMKIAPHGDENAIVVCSYTITKEGLVKAKITELQGTDEFKEKAKSHLPAGLEWSFTWKVKADSATLEDVQGKDVDVIKQHMEGEFAKK